VDGLVTVWALPRAVAADLLSSLAADPDPLSDLLGIGTCSSAQVSLGPETRGHDWRDRLRPSCAQARVLGEQVRPIASELLQLGDGLVPVVDHSASTVPTAGSSDPGRQELVGRAHARSLLPGPRVRDGRDIRGGSAESQHQHQI
jgi:hypothetical protein